MNLVIKQDRWMKKYFYTSNKIQTESKNGIEFDYVKVSPEVTKNEVKALKSIVDNDHFDGINSPIYSKGANPFSSKKGFSGVLSSLVKKGYAGTCWLDNSDCCYITESGFQVLKNLGLEEHGK